MKQEQSNEIAKRVSVYELTQGAAALLSRGSEGFETDEELSAWQAECQGWMEASGDKLVACRVVMDRADAEEAYLRAESARLAERARRFAAVRVRIKELAIAQMQAHVDMGGKPKVETADGSTVSLVTTRTLKVEVTDVDEIPTAWVRTKVEADLPKIKQAYKDGLTIPGVVVTEVESQSLRFGK